MEEKKETVKPVETISEAVALIFPTYQEIGEKLVTKAKETDNARKVDATTNVVSKYIDLIAGYEQQKLNIEHQLGILNARLKAIANGEFEVQLLTPFDYNRPANIKGENVAQIQGTNNSVLIIFQNKELN